MIARRGADEDRDSICGILAIELEEGVLPMRSRIAPAQAKKRLQERE